MGKLITISGVKRSFSTGQFNIVRISLERAGYKVNVLGPPYKLRDIPNKEIDLLKIHKYDEDIANRADKIFLTERNWLEVKNSMIRFYERDITDSDVEHEFLQLKKWKWHSKIPVFHFELWDDYPMIYIELVLKYLNINDSVGEIFREFNNLELPDEGKDEKTLLFHNHITR